MNSRRVETWRQELMSNGGREGDAAYWLASHGMFNLLSYRIHIHFHKGGTTHYGLGLPPLIVN